MVPLRPMVVRLVAVGAGLRPGRVGAGPWVVWPVGRRVVRRSGGLGHLGLLGVSRTALKAVFQAACLAARCSSSTSLGVLYPRAEWSRF